MAGLLSQPCLRRTRSRVYRAVRGTGVVQVRQVRSTFDENSSYYGVRFVVLDDELRRVLYDLVAHDRRHLDSAWTSSR